jgi:HK97 family phage major capsid protein
MELSKLEELRGEIKAGREKLHEIFEQAGADMDMSKVSVLEGDGAAKAAEIRRINTEIEAAVKAAEPLEAEYADLERAKRQAEEAGAAGHPLPEPSEREGKVEAKSIGELFVAHQIGTEQKGRAVHLPDVDPMATLFKTTEGWTPETTRTGRVIDKETRPIQVTDVIPTGNTSQQAVVFMKEVTFTNAAAEKAEAAEYPEAALKLEEAESPVRKIPVWLPITDEQIEDVAQVQGYVNRRLPFMVRQRLDGQIVNGDGEAPNLEGLSTAAGQEQAKGEDPTPDAIYKANTKVEVTGRAMPGPVLIHPNDWQEVRLLRTNEGVYIWGNPSEAGPETIWGHRIVKTDALTEGTAITGDFAGYSELAYRRGLELKVSDSHSDFFIKGKQAIRADIRVALVVYRPNAFVKVTGI